MKSMASAGVEGAACPFLLCADLHFDKSNLVQLRQTSEWFVDDVKRVKPLHVIILGDSLHSRAAVNTESIVAFTWLIQQLLQVNNCSVQIHILIGNHDLVNRNTRQVHSLKAFGVQYERIHIYEEIEVKVLEGVPVLFLPWHEEQKEIIAWWNNHGASLPYKAKDIVVCGHLAIPNTQVHGFDEHTVADSELLTLQWLSQFKRTFAGHFHGHATYFDHTTYVGSITQHNFGDAGDTNKGYVKYWPATNEFILVKNPHAAKFFTTSLEEVLALGDTGSTFYDSNVRISLAQHHYDDTKLGEAIKKLRTGWGVKNIKTWRPKATTIEGRSEQPTAPTKNDLWVSAKTWLESLGEEERLKQPVGILYDALVEATKNANPPGERKTNSETMPSAEISCITVTNFMGIQGTVTFDLGVMGTGVWIVSGQNGAGKSTILEAITWCLFGKLLRGGSAVDMINDQTPTGGMCSVRVDFQSGWKILRERPNSKGKSSRIHVIDPKGNDTEKGTTASGQQFVDEVVGIDYDTYVRTVLLSSSTTPNFIGSTLDQKREILETMFGFTVFESWFEYFKHKAATEEQESEVWKQQISDSEQAMKLDQKELDQISKLRQSLVHQARETCNHTIKRLQTLLMTHEGKLREVEKESKTLSDEAKASDDIRSRHRSVQDEIKQCQGEFDLLVGQLRDNRLENAGLQNKVIEHMQQVNQRSMEQQKKLTAELHAAQEVDNDRKELTRLQNIENELRMRLKESLRKLIDEFPTTKKLVDATILPLVDELPGATMDPIELKTKCRILQDKISSQSSSDVQSAQAALAQWHKKQKSSQKVESDAEALVRVNNQAHQILETKFAILKGKIKTLQASLQELDKKLAGLENNSPRREELAVESHRITDQIATLRSEREQVTRDTEASIARLETDTVDVAEKKQRLSNNIDRLKQIIRASQDALQHWQTKKLPVTSFWCKKLDSRKHNRAAGLRAYCLEMEIAGFNRLLSINIESFNETAQGFLSDSASLGCKLTDTLELQELPGARSIAARSDGQRRRVNLALFFTMCQLCQGRSTFVTNIVGLDEIYDSLDECGQLSAQRWIQEHFSAKVVLLITHAPARVGGTLHTMFVEKGKYTLRRNDGTEHVIVAEKPSLKRKGQAPPPTPALKKIRGAGHE